MTTDLIARLRDSRELHKNLDYAAADALEAQGKLIEQQHEVIECLSACALHAPKLTQQMRFHALAAYETWRTGK